MGVAGVAGVACCGAGASLVAFKAESGTVVDEAADTMLIGVGTITDPRVLALPRHGGRCGGGVGAAGATNCGNSAGGRTATGEPGSGEEETDVVSVATLSDGNDLVRWDNPAALTGATGPPVSEAVDEDGVAEASCDTAR